MTHRQPYTPGPRGRLGVFSGLATAVLATGLIMISRRDA